MTAVRKISAEKET